MTTNQREEDTVSRYGGEEFVMIMPHTNSIQAIIIAERVREKIENHTFSFENHTFNVTISGGISTYPESGRKIKSLLKAADSALYSAKYSGKNEIVVYTRQNRKYLRIDFIENICIEKLNGTQKYDVNFQSKNLSKNGILFENDTHLDIGTHLRIKIPVNGISEPLEVDGVVARVEVFDSGKYDIGVSFTNMGKNLKSGIAQTIIRHLQQVDHPQNNSTNTEQNIID